jgi:hypothetical protein
MFMNAAAGFKSIARTAAFHHWQSPHRPEGMKVSKMALFKTEHMRLPAHCGMKREGSELPTLQLPIHDMYLRHYRFYSLSEFMESRGAFKFSAAGKEVNPCNNMMRLNVNIPQPPFLMQPRYAFKCTRHTNIIAKKWQEHCHVCYKC